MLHGAKLDNMYFCIHFNVRNECHKHCGSFFQDQAFELKWPDLLNTLQESLLLYYRMTSLLNVKSSDHLTPNTFS